MVELDFVVAVRSVGRLFAAAFLFAAVSIVGANSQTHSSTPLNQQPAYRDISVFGPLPNADRAAARVLSIPMHAYLDEATQDRIADAVAAAV